MIHIASDSYRTAEQSDKCQRERLTVCCGTVNLTILQYNMRMCVFLPVCVCVSAQITGICKPVVSTLPLSFLLSPSDTLTMSGHGTTDPNHRLVTHVTQLLSLGTCVYVCV